MLSTDDTMARSNALNKRMGLSFSAVSQISFWSSDAAAANNGADWVGIQYPRGDDGTLAMVPGGYGIGSHVAVVTTAVRPERLELMMRVLDYGYSRDGMLYWNYGPQGVSWNFGPDGQVVYTPLIINDPNGLADASGRYSGTTWTGASVQTTRLIHLRQTPQGIAANNTWFFPNQDVTAFWTIPPGVTRTSAESLRINELNNAISTYVDEMAVQFLTGEVPFSQWDSYVQRVNSMGLAELIRLQQAAYDRYLAR